MTYFIDNDHFQGPMDLLLELIKKREMDIYDIEIHLLVDDFMDYIKKLESLDLEVTSDFIVMASYLLKIKSQMLVPKYTIEEDEIIEEDPREELVSRIVEYEKMKKVSEELKNLEEYEKRAVYRKQADFSYFSESELLKNLKLEDLVHSFSQVMNRYNRLESAKEELEKIPAQEFTLEEAKAKINIIFKEQNMIRFSSFLNLSKSKNELITYFLTILELIKSKEIIAKQNKREEDILLKKIGGDFGE